MKIYLNILTIIQQVSKPSNIYLKKYNIKLYYK